jgi:hypothetical protein
LANVLGAGDGGPVPGEDAPTPGVDLGLEDDAVSGALEAEVEAADAGEQGSDIHAVPDSSSRLIASSRWDRMGPKRDHEPLCEGLRGHARLSGASVARDDESPAFAGLFIVLQVVA